MMGIVKNDDGLCWQNIRFGEARDLNFTQIFVIP